MKMNLQLFASEREYTFTNNLDNVTVGDITLKITPDNAQIPYEYQISATGGTIVSYTRDETNNVGILVLTASTISVDIECTENGISND